MMRQRLNCSGALILVFLVTSLAAAPRNSGSVSISDKANGIEVNIVRQKEEIPGIQEFRVEAINNKPKERTLHGKIVNQDGSSQKVCTVYLPMPPSANAVDTIRCQAADTAVYWQFEVIKVYDFILEN